jgi:hypothetical protein
VLVWRLHVVPAWRHLADRWPLGPRSHGVERWQMPPIVQVSIRDGHSIGVAALGWSWPEVVLSRSDVARWRTKTPRPTLVYQRVVVKSTSYDRRTVAGLIACEIIGQSTLASFVGSSNRASFEPGAGAQASKTAAMPSIAEDDGECSIRRSAGVDCWTQIWPTIAPFSLTPDAVDRSRCRVSSDQTRSPPDRLLP